MLTRLRITNFALLEEIEIDFTAGLSLFTGETGAGKSILIDAICRILGARASQDDVRAGAPRAVLEAIFDISNSHPALAQLLSDWNIEIDDEELILRREIQPGGKSRAVVNQCSVTLAQLKELAPFLMDVYGQNEHQGLLDSASQRALFDRSIGAHQDTTDLAALAEEIQTSQQEIKNLREQEQQRQRNMDLLQYQIREIEGTGISEGEEEALRTKRAVMQNGERINNICEALLQDIVESDESLLGRIESIGKQLEELKQYQEPFSAYITRCMEWLDELNELARKVDSMKQTLEFEEGSLDEIESRLDVLDRLKKKYGPTIPDVLQHLVRCKEELNTNFQAEWRAEQILMSLEKSVDSYNKLAEKISAMRDKGRSAFERKIENELKNVAMEKCKFRVILSPVAQSVSTGNQEQLINTDFPAYGHENILFQIEPNPGEGFRELSKIASGGELARLMLALKVVTQSVEGRCLIFDEIDAGVGGRVAFQIGERLRRLSQNAQVLCVTHLPQVAAFGEHHYKVSKKIKKDRTTTIVDDLPEDERIQELARMMSGSEVTETALQHARQLRDQVETGVR
ncbi:MAG TPA: DNA repair protein RecN [Acidobacteriota bacterium]|nr:DNA repair protein RecN [Acidobacteriota bacterium]